MTDPLGWLIEGDDARPVYPHDATGVGMRDLVLIGDTIAEVREWAAALDVRPWNVRRRLLRGATVLDALREMPTGRPKTRTPSDAEVAAFIAAHPGGGTLDEIGELFGVTRERIRQIEERALRQLRDAWPEELVRAVLYAAQQRDDEWCAA